MLRLVLLIVLASPTLLLAQAPNLTSVFPCGAQRGTTLELTLAGHNVHEPLGIVASFPVKVTFIPPSTDPAKTVVKLEVPADAPLGWHTIRLHTRRGLSNLKLFCVDELPQVMQAGLPGEPAKAQPVPVPCVVCGTMNQQQRHYYAVKLNAGQRLCTEILGRRLGSPLDPVLALYDAASGKQLAFSDDTPGLQKDARFAFVAPQAGTYHIEVRDVRDSGGNEWHYRLRLGDFPLVSTTFPLAIQRGKKATLSFAGPLVDGVEPVEVRAPSDGTVQAISVTPRFANRPNTQAGWPAQALVSDMPEVTSKAMPLNNRPIATQVATPSPATQLVVPSAVSARFLQKGEKHQYRFSLPGGVNYRIRALANELGSPASLVMVLTDTKGVNVASSNREADVTQIDFTAPKAGEYILTTEHLYFDGGPEQSYRVSVSPVEPSFTLSATVDRVDIPQRNRAVLVVQADRAGGYTGPIALELKKPCTLTGTAIIPADKNSVMLEVGADNTAVEADTLVIEGKNSNSQAKTPVEYVRMHPQLKALLPELVYPPLVINSLPGVSIMPAAPFSFHAEFVHPHGVHGVPMPVRFRIARQGGFQGEVNITSMMMPGAVDQKPFVPAMTAKVAAGQQETTDSLLPEVNTPQLEPIVFQAKAVVDGREVTLTTALGTLKFGPALTVATRNTSLVTQPWKGLGKPKLSPYLAVDLLSRSFHPSTLDVRWLPQPLASEAVEVLITRHGGFNGPVQVELVNTPAGTLAGSALVPAGQDQVLIPVAVKSGTKPVTKNDVQVQATAVGLANQIAKSQPISVTVK